MDKWQPIETVPMDGTPVLVWLSEPHLKSHIHAAFFHPNLKCVGGVFIFDLEGKPTHWMPMPLGPSEEDKMKYAQAVCDALNAADMPTPIDGGTVNE